MNYTVAFQLLTGVLYSNLNKIQMEIAKLSKKEMSEVIKICLKFYKLLNGDDDNSTSNMTNKYNDKIFGCLGIKYYWETFI